MKKKKSTYRTSIIAGFTALYVTSMLLSTYLLKNNYAEEYGNYLLEQRDAYVSEFESEDLYLGSGDEERVRNISSYAAMRLSEIKGKDEYQQISGALYDASGNLRAVTTDIIGTNRYQKQYVTDEEYQNQKQDISAEYFLRGPIYEFFPVEDYLSETQIQNLLKYRETLNKNMIYEEAEKIYGENFRQMTDAVYAKHYMNLILNDFFELTGIEIEEEWMNLSIQKPVNGKEREVVWEWKKEQEIVETGKTVAETGKAYTGIMIFPYMTQGEKERERWMQDQWLQGYADKVDNLEEVMEEYGKESQRQIMYMLFFRKNLDANYDDAYRFLLVLRETSHPWLAAMNDMKYVYLMGAILTLACMIKVIYSTHKNYREREKLESMRRDFTNAAAHELKTPLSVIRGFAENLKEDTVKEKREYYLDQIINQTEQIDELVKEMIHISKLDSDEIVLNRQQYSLVELVKEQMSKFDAQMEEKNLHVLYEVEQDFILEADLDKMGRAIWNLLSNAVEYNRADGSIWIFSEKDKLSIENTGTAIPAEVLSHVFEMFYTGDESRHERSRHMGLGLYLAKRICEIHGLKIEICNTDAGVRTTIYR
ncbi:MAG: HAMP domain-containing histidine kinase [Lachnospiraceae bacterium]|nr:HAMP domain-containing histidine kinase [Lachnospiraceae bacterium]